MITCVGLLPQATSLDEFEEYSVALFTPLRTYVRGVGAASEPWIPESALQSTICSAIVLMGVRHFQLPASFTRYIVIVSV